ncbi:hypothetical protein [Aquimarina mytili]|uniref:Uncharacterized protein n=1 Tax=Aquimarina mytili TaxID=874423 RepID=A0A936ZSP3_9FLAO|nr:hypothetical protein [Aquimarina mytili]MBL0683587.1 hypothetical protein [Aquimarina mytili]
MLTLEEQLVFLEASCDQKIRLLEQISEQFGEVNNEIFTTQIDHTMFCYESVITSIRELQNIKSK